MKKEVVPCVCGEMAEITRLPILKVFMIKCKCGRRTGADTKGGAIHFWNKLMTATAERWDYSNG